MRTLHTGPVLACMLLRYERLMNADFKAFLRKAILMIDMKSEIRKQDVDPLANLLCDIQDDGDYSDENLQMFLDFIKLNEVNVREPYSAG